MPVKPWFLGAEQATGLGQWGLELRCNWCNGISACKTYLIPELHPPSVFRESFEKGPSQCVSTLGFLSGWPVVDQWKILQNFYSFVMGFGSGCSAFTVSPSRCVVC